MGCSGTRSAGRFASGLPRPLSPVVKCKRYTMKRDMDLVRAILLAVEEHDHGFAPDDLEIDGFTEEQIAYHAFIMMEGGLLEGIDMTTRGSESPEAAIRHLTWAGHEFLDAAREPARWNQAKEVIKKVGGATLAVWTAVLTELVKKSVGLSP